MSIVGFRVVPNNNYLNACTCVCPLGVPHLAALRAAHAAAALGCPILTWRPENLRAPSHAVPHPT